jgi:uncharacterized membrane protein
MKRKQFTTRLDEKKILSAIRDAEAKTSGEVCVFISDRSCPDPLDAAERHFHRLGCANTKHRNAILIFIAPPSQTFALFGDVGIHEKCGPEFWNAVRDEAVRHLQAGQYTDAITSAVAKAGGLLAQNFPVEVGDRNELANKIERD